MSAAQIGIVGLVNLQHVIGPPAMAGLSCPGCTYTFFDRDEGALLVRFQGHLRERPDCAEATIRRVVLGL